MTRGERQGEATTTGLGGNRAESGKPADARARPAEARHRAARRRGEGRNGDGGGKPVAQEAGERATIERANRRRGEAAKGARDSADWLQRRGLLPRVVIVAHCRSEWRQRRRWRSSNFELGNVVRRWRVAKALVGVARAREEGLLTWGRESMWGHHLARCFCLAKVGQPAHEFGQPDGLAIGWPVCWSSFLCLNGQILTWRG